jgi:glycosyltransferase involved in cell wall biosynthesis
VNRITKPLTLSIIIPVYNDARYLRDCLESIENQSVAPDEVIVVDNNSNDESAQIAKSFSFVTLVHEKKQGVFYARNRGFNTSKADIIGRIDSDTVLPKSWVSFVKKFYEKNEHLDSAITGSGFFYNMPLHGVHSWIWAQIAIRVNRLILGHYILWGSNMALPRTMWMAVRGDMCARTDIHEDLDLAIHLHRHAFQIRYDAKLRVGVAVRRVLSDRSQLRGNLLLWPNTLRAHQNPKWIVGWVGAYLLLVLSPVLVIESFIARLIRRY